MILHRKSQQLGAAPFGAFEPVGLSYGDAIASGWQYDGAKWSAPDNPQPIGIGYYDALAMGWVYNGGDSWTAPRSAFDWRAAEAITQAIQAQNPQAAFSNTDVAFANVGMTYQDYVEIENRGHDQGGFFADFVEPLRDAVVELVSQGPVQATIAVITAGVATGAFAGIEAASAVTGFTAEEIASAYAIDNAAFIEGMAAEGASAAEIAAAIDADIGAYTAEQIAQVAAEEEMAAAVAADAVAFPPEKIAQVAAEEVAKASGASSFKPWEFIKQYAKPAASVLTTGASIAQKVAQKNAQQSQAVPGTQIVRASGNPSALYDPRINPATGTYDPGIDGASRGVSILKMLPLAIAAYALVKG